MSLVITAWNESNGVAVCEGRIAARIGGKFIPLEENYSKLTRLPNGSILGITGKPREGFPVTVPLRDVLEQHLRPAIVKAAWATDFRGLCGYIPALLKVLSTAFPGLLFFVQLLGIEDGIVRGAAFDSNGSVTVPTVVAAPTWQIGGTEETVLEADVAVRACLTCIGLHDPLLTSGAIRGIIRELAREHAEINDRTHAEFISPAATMTADVITSGTLDASVVTVDNLDASNITTGTMSATKVLFPDGSALTTASRVLTAKASPTGGLTTTTSMQAVPGFGFTATAGSTADVYNVSATIDLAPVSAVSQGVTVWLVLDGNTASPLQSFTYWVNPSTPNHNFVPFFASVTGLSAGSHTLSFYAAATVYNSSTAVSSTSYAICQRIF